MTLIGARSASNVGLSKRARGIAEMTGSVHAGREGLVATITMDRPAEGNVLTMDMIRALGAALRSAGESDAKVILLRSTGNDFCRGRETKSGPPPSAMALRDNVLQPILNVFDAVTSVPQPVIGAVQGGALGFGCALATACDITLAADSARFRLPELEKDLPPTLAMSAMMSRVPRKALAWMVYTGAEIDARTAHRFGIASSVVPLGELEAAAKQLSATLTARSRDALLAVKEYMRSAAMMEPRGAAAYGGTLLSAVLSSAGC
jgi:enoyl-CoA hydratase/carnithine racemase